MHDDAFIPDALTINLIAQLTERYHAIAPTLMLVGT